MFRRVKRREDSVRAQCAEQHEQELARLRHEVGRLEGALLDVLSASDDVLIDLGRAQRERAQLADRVAPGFADAWFSSDPAPSGLDEFFTISEVDKRARRWLLSSN